MPTLCDTPITAYGVRSVSRPLAAQLLGFSMKALRQVIGNGQLSAKGRVQLRVPLAEIEAILGRPVSAHDYLVALHSSTRRGRDEPEI
jgi:hypothetical protein